MEGIIAERAAAVGGFELPFMDVVRCDVFSLIIGQRDQN